MGNCMSGETLEDDDFENSLPKKAARCPKHIIGMV